MHLCPNKIFIITDIKFKRFLPNAILNDNSCIVVDENAIIDSLTINHVKDLFGNLGRDKMRRFAVETSL